MVCQIKLFTMFLLEMIIYSGFRSYYIYMNLWLNFCNHQENQTYNTYARDKKKKKCLESIDKSRKVKSPAVLLILPPF